MLRGITVALGIGLIMLFLSGLAINGGTAPWMPWIDLIAGVMAFVFAAVMRPEHPRAARGGGAIFLALSLFALGLLAFSSNAAPWLAVWNFLFAGALFLVGLGALIDFDERAFSLPAHEPHRYDEASPTGFGHGFRFPADRYYYPLPGEWVARRAPRHYTRPDHRIEEDIYERLAHGWELDASDILVSVKNGEVTLSGAVDSRRSRRYAEEIADNVFGVKDILNDLEICSQQAPKAGGKPKPTQAA